MLKRGYHGVHHRMSHKHLHRCVAEFAGCHDVREQGMMKQMESIVARMVGKRIMYGDFLS